MIAGRYPDDGVTAILASRLRAEAQLRGLLLILSNHDGQDAGGEGAPHDSGCGEGLLAGSGQAGDPLRTA